MKKILKISSLFLLLGIISCSDEDRDPVISNNGIALKVPVSGTDYVFTPERAGENALTLVWDRADYGMATQATYAIEIAETGTDFAEPLSAVVATDVLGSNTTYTWKVGYINQLLNDIGFAPCESMSIDVRIKSTLGLNPEKAQIQYSNPLTLSIKPYSLALPLMAFATSAGNAAAAPKVASSGVLKTDYEGYMWLTPGTYKFYTPNECAQFETPTGSYGDNGNGSFDTLVLNAGDGYEITTAGFYLVKADTDPTKLKYSVRLINWNIFGAAKPNFPNANTPLAYNATTKLWETDFVLSNGYDFQFRSNGTGENALVLGGFDATKTGLDFAGSIMSYKGKAIEVPGGPKSVPRVNKRYHIALDLNSPRNYKFSIVENPLP